MERRKLVFSIILIILVSALVIGGTYAWFTAQVDFPAQNVFVAGTVMIEAGEEIVMDENKMGNVNPGDCFLKCIDITNIGTKAIELRLVDVGFSVLLNQAWLTEYWEELGLDEDYSEYSDAAALQTAVNNGEIEIPVFLAPCPDSGWVMKYVKDEDIITGFEFYYAGGPILGDFALEGVEVPNDADRTVTLCLVVAFDGAMMDNIWQGATWTQLNGTFEAVQASNEAPLAVWGDDWDPNWFAMSPGEALAFGTSNAYAGYFYDNGVFNFLDCCSQGSESE